MMYAQQRIAELWVASKARCLSQTEADEMIVCMNLNATYAYKLAKLKNLSLMASMTNDYAWLHDICAEIEKLEEQYLPKIKKPDTESAD